MINAWSDLSLRANICTGLRAVCVFEVGSLLPPTAPVLPKLAASSVLPSSGAAPDKGSPPPLAVNNISFHLRSLDAK